MGADNQQERLKTVGWVVGFVDGDEADFDQLLERDEHPGDGRVAVAFPGVPVEGVADAAPDATPRNYHRCPGAGVLRLVPQPFRIP